MYDTMKPGTLPLALVIFLVVITDSGAQLSPQLQGSPGTSKIIRFLGNSYIQYDFNVLLQEPLSPVVNETHTFQFITTVGDGLLWLFKGDNREVIHISLKNGDLLFVYDDGSGNIQQKIVRALSNLALNDFRWHSLKVEKLGTSLKFYIDGVYVDEMRTRKELQFVSRGNIYLGGTSKTSELTNGLVTSNFDGAITDIEFRKYPRPLRELIISLLQFVDTAAKYGDFFVLDRDKWGSGNWSWPTRAPPTQPPPPTLPPSLPTPVTFISSSATFALRDPLDMRAGGSIEFRFKTKEPRGLLLVASGQGSVFLGMEIFDGNLYFVYNFGSASNRELIAEEVDNGMWHDVQIIARSDRVLVNIDGQTVPIRKQESTSSSQLYFHKVFFGGYDNFDRTPWALYSRLGYKGCMESLKINGIGVDLHRHVGSTGGVVTGCRTMSSSCPTQPCARGYCRDMMEDFQCECANTPYRGKLCDEKAIVASWNGSTAATYDFTRLQNTHTNDLSVRFNTPLKNTLLFKTECDTKDDYIQAELEDGRVKVTVRVDGRTKIFRSGQSVNDYRWHTLSIRRRADDFKIWVDDNDQIAGVLGGENYELKIDRIHFASPTGALGSNNYIGFMQNFMYEDQDLFDLLKKQTTSVFWITDYDDTIQPTYKPVTVTSSDTHFQLTPMTVGLTMNILFKFKTKETNGLILYNKGAGNDVIAVELSNGMIRLAYNLGGEDRFVLVPTKTPLNDNEWHTVRILLNEKGQISAKVDDAVYDVSTSSGDGRLDLTESLYIAGLPAEMFQRSRIRNLIESRQGFRGCLASMDLNGAVPDLINFAKDKSLIKEGCFNLDITCIPGVCGPGQCVPGLNDYWCNCNMTGHIGRPCSDYPVGYYFGSVLGTGLISYKFPFEYQTDYDMDNIAFGFMTEKENGILMRLDSSLADEYIQIALRNGHVVVESKTGEGVVVLEESRHKFNDGKYHTVRYVRTGTGSSLMVDSLSAQSVAHSGSASVFDKVYHVMIGGREDSKGAMMDSFIGIIGGAYWNGYRWFDLLKDGKAVYGNLVKMRGDVVLTNAYILVKPTPSQPPPIFIPPNGEVPPNIGGGGIISGPGIGGSGSGGGPDIIGLIGPPGSGGIVGGATGVAGAGGASALASAGLAGSSLPPLAMGSRAGAVVGAVIGTLAFLTSLMWALYGLKPGIPNIFSPGAGSAAGGVTSISPPRATSNIAAVQAASAGGGVGGGGGGSASKVMVVNGSATAGSGAGAGAGGGAGGGSSTYTSYFQSTSTAITAGGGGAGGSAGGSSSATAGGAGYDTATLRATGTFSNKGTAIGTPKANRAHLGSSSSAVSGYSTGYSGGADAGIVGGGVGSAYSYDRNYMTSTSSASGGGGGGMDIPDYDLPVSGAGTMSSNFKSSASKAYSTSTLASNYNYQVQSLKTVTINRQGQYMMSGGSMGGTVTPGAAGDEVRVDCCLMTSDGDNVVTGSSLGPPQVWNMQSGELMRIMKGDTVGSTHLHLVCGDRLLVGSVHADLEINEYSGRKGVFNHTLQIWDFVTGKPLEMAEGEYCSALVVMSDNDKILFGRTDKFGDATSIIAWDLMGNQPIKEMRYDAPVGNNDYISFLRLSKNDRYVVAGFTNSFDNFAEFLVFDMTLTSYNIMEPGHLRLDANPECTAILNNDEAVTGLRNGDLVIWNLRTGTASRQLLASSGAHAHSREVKAVALSDDGRYLASGSADGTLKVWDMATERLVHALSGHSDEVWCASISPDNEIIVSGSNDGTIRLWRMKNGSEMCVFNTGIDIFQVTMSHDKGTIVALGDKYGARKLIMLQVVRTKIRRQIVS
ncbi:hypothetical protein ACJMK2_013712 [Sinanodonta woodiana]|uniref:Uncharacterized protein n=1 Tax=Sinanodonta woodiana TaxID=1069815 RepID=A0ABD3V1G5_SINWO